MSRVTTSDLGAARHLAGLDTPEAGRFVRKIRFSIATGGQATGASVAPGTVLNTGFFNRTVNAMDADAPEQPTFGLKGSDATITLPVAREFRDVLLKNPDGDDKIAAYRFDGDVVSEEAVETANHFSNGARLNVTDAALILRRKNNGSEFSLGSTQIERLGLRYRPVNPRVSLQLAESDDPPIPLAVDTDADGVPVFPTSGQYGEALADAVQALIDGLENDSEDTEPYTVPDPLSFDLILVSDTPCSALVSALNLGLILERPALPEKSVLRFGDTPSQIQSLSLDLPNNAVLSGGTLSMTVSGVAPGPARQADPLVPLPVPNADGFRILPDAPIASRFIMDQARTLAGAECIIAAPSGPAEIVARLHADADGLPGDELAVSEIQTVERAAPSIVSFDFPATPVPAGPVWLAIATSKGDAIAMTGSTGPIARIEGPSFVLLQIEPATGLAASLRPVQTLETATLGGPSVQIPGEVPLVLPTSGTTDIDLTAFSTALSTSPVVTVSSRHRALVSVDPPMIFYSLS